MAVDRDVEVLFPLSGINQSSEFGRQPKGTTPSGENVRAFEVLGTRGRGGSRAGLAKFPKQQVPAGRNLIQHLNLIVDPQSAALISDVDTNGIADPSTNNITIRNFGRTIRRGGSARQPNRNDPRPGGSSGFIQSKTGLFPWNGNQDIVVEFDSPVTSTSLILAVLNSSTSQNDRRNEMLPDVLGADHPGQIQNENGDPFTQVDDYRDSQTTFGGAIPGTNYWSLSMFYLASGAGTADRRISSGDFPHTSNLPVGSTLQFTVLELALATGGPVDVLGTSDAGDASWELGALTLAGGINIVVEALLGAKGDHTEPTECFPAPNNGFTERQVLAMLGAFGRGTISTRLLTAVTVDCGATVSPGSFPSNFVGIAAAWERT